MEPSAVQRHILLLKCDHPVAQCQKCQTGFHFPELGSDLFSGHRFNICPLCGRDLSQEVLDHIRLCPNFADEATG
jgi:hypothetical protein